MKFIQSAFSSFHVSHLFIAKNRLDPLSYVFSNVLPKFCQVLNEFAAAESSLPCKRLGDGSKRVQLPQFLQHQVKLNLSELCLSPKPLTVVARHCLITLVFLSAVGGWQIVWIEPDPVHHASWHHQSQLTEQLYTPNYANYELHKLINFFLV